MVLPILLGFAMGALAGGCGTSGDDLISETTPHPQENAGIGGYGGSSGGAGRAGEGGMAGSGGAPWTPSCSLKDSFQPVDVSVDENGKILPGISVKPEVNNAGIVAFQYYSNPLDHSKLWTYHGPQKKILFRSEQSDPDLMASVRPSLTGEALAFKSQIISSMGQDASIFNLRSFALGLTLSLNVGEALIFKNDPALISTGADQGFLMGFDGKDPAVSSVGPLPLKGYQCFVARLSPNFKVSETLPLQNALGETPNSWCLMGRMSQNGKFLTFLSDATNLDSSHPPPVPGRVYVYRMEVEMGPFKIKNILRIQDANGLPPDFADYKQDNDANLDMTEFKPAISDQGDVVFMSETLPEPGTRSLLFFDAASQEVKTASPGPAIGYPSLSQSGDRLAYIEYGTGRNLVVLDLKSGQKFKPVNPSPFEVDEAKLSPNGRWAAYTEIKPPNEVPPLATIKLVDLCD